MEDFGVKSLSETIGILIELRYLGLRNNYIQEIPHSLGGLKKLEVLDIALNFMVEVPDIIKEMVSLRHLYMSDVIFRKPLNVDALHNLVTLTYISIYEVSILKQMTCLHKLGIEDVDENSDVSKLLVSLARMNNPLLTLRGFRFKIMPCLDNICYLDKLKKLRLDGRLTRLPSSIKFMDSLRYLVLVNTCLDEDPMSVLQETRHLEVIKLRNAYTGRLVIEEHSFSLKVLRINELWNLRDVQVGKGAMSQLQQLEIMNCPLMETLPNEIGSISSLWKLKMITTKDIATTIRKLDCISKIAEVDISP